MDIHTLHSSSKGGPKSFGTVLYQQKILVLLRERLEVFSCRYFERQVSGIFFRNEIVLNKNLLRMKYIHCLLIRQLFFKIDEKTTL